jgi:ectoine hydroxylase-related dioxygenase (phytanoyl-CoA dioxygenase family)
MTPEELFAFDAQGYLRLPGVLSGEQVAELQRTVDRRGADGSSPATGERTHADIVTWGPGFQALIDQPRVLRVLRGTLGERFRLDHDYLIAMRPGAGRGPLHGGDGGMDDWWYRCRDGVIRTGMLSVLFALTPTRRGDGGFCCVPGSHKSGMISLAPPAGAFLSAVLPEEVRSFARIPDYLVQPELDVGDVLLFTEALVHGTLPWRGVGERRVALLKYTPGHCCAQTPRYRLEDFPELTAQQRSLLSPPSLYDREPVP